MEKALKVFNESMLSKVSTEEDFQDLMTEYSNSDGLVLMEDTTPCVKFDLQLPEDSYSVKEAAELFDREVVFKGNLPKGVGARILFPEAQMADRPNRNKRIYVFEDMGPATKKFNSLAKRGEGFVLNSHPDYFSAPTMEDISALVKESKFDSDTGFQGLILDIMEDTAPMRILKMGGALPISSRALAKVSFSPFYEGKFGSFGKKPKLDKEGNVIKDESYYKNGFLILRKYEFLAYDFVPGTQSVPSAIHRPSQARNRNLATTEKQITHTLTESATQDHMEIQMKEEELAKQMKQLLEGQVALEARLTKQDAVKAKDLSNSILESKESEITSLKEALVAMTEKSTDLEVALEKAEKSTEVLVVDPEVLKAQEATAALAKELKEMKEAQSLLESEKVSALLLVQVESLLEKSKYSDYKDIMKSVIGSPTSEDDAKERVSLAEALVFGILSKYRSSSKVTADESAPNREISRIAAMQNINENLMVPGAGHVPFQESATPEGQLKIMMGDNEDINAFG